MRSLVYSLAHKKGGEESFVTECACVRSRKEEEKGEPKKTTKTIVLFSLFQSSFITVVALFEAPKKPGAHSAQTGKRQPLMHEMEKEGSVK